MMRPLPYHENLATYLREQEPETWAWFDSAQAQADYAENVRLDLLKQTYRLEPTTHPALFEALTAAQTRLGLGTVPATLYQSQTAQHNNAALCFLPGEIHIIFEGGLVELLEPAELAGVLGHELAHYLLWSDRRHLIADRVAQGMARDPRAEPAHGETARLARLYTEIYADRGALEVVGDADAVIRGLVKSITGIRQVDAASYVKQADEVFARAKVRTEGLSHPEAFIRARAIALWAARGTEGETGVDAEVARMLEGPLSLDRLDLLAQHRLTGLTRRWLECLLQPAWFHTEAVRGHARLFFEDFSLPPPPPAPGEDDLFAQLREAESSVRDYFCYTLLDFAVADPELEQEPLREAFRLAARCDWGDRLESLAAKDLKLKKRDVQKLRAEAEETAGEATASA